MKVNINAYFFPHPRKNWWKKYCWKSTIAKKAFFKSNTHNLYFLTNPQRKISKNGTQAGTWTEPLEALEGQDDPAADADDDAPEGQETVLPVQPRHVLWAGWAEGRWLKRRDGLVRVVYN